MDQTVEVAAIVSQLAEKPEARSREGRVYSDRELMATQPTIGRINRGADQVGTLQVNPLPLSSTCGLSVTQNNAIENAE